MSSANHYSDWASKAAWLLLVVTCLGAYAMTRSASQLEVGTGLAPRAPRAVSAPQPGSGTGFAESDWSLFCSRLTPGAAALSSSSSISSRLRFVGGFFAYTETLASSSRVAILEDLKTGEQRNIPEGERMGDVMVVKVFRDRVIVRDSFTEEQLWRFAKVAVSAVAATRPAETNQPNDQVSDAEEINGFGGRQTGDRQWVFNRQGLINYYQKLRDEPERLVKVFDSLKPLYDGEHRITGYHLDVQGESDFFQAAGLKQGDVIRSVNDMSMTNRRRAEYFITEFVADRANAFVLDVERDGQPTKLTYQVK